MGLITIGAGLGLTISFLKAGSIFIIYTSNSVTKISSYLASYLYK